MVKSLLIILTIIISDAAVAQGSVNFSKPVKKNVNYDSLRAVMEVMLHDDQNIRRIIIDSLGINSPEAPKYFQKMMEIDMRNRQQMQIILDKYGWLERSKIGEKAAESMFYVIQHTDLETVNKYYPQFKKLAKRGEASTKLCAMMEDRKLMWEGKKQIYGSQASNQLRPDGSYAIWPIENASKVNKRRKKVGFETMVEEAAAALNASYNPNEELPK